jgi:hypothetical protein
MGEGGRRPDEGSFVGLFVRLAQSVLAAWLEKLIRRLKSSATFGTSLGKNPVLTLPCLVEATSTAGSSASDHQVPTA